jgi:drug/metabolite transporter (DMT)-like permease
LSQQLDRPIFGIFLMIGFCLLAPLGDGVAKILGETLSVGQILFVRFIAQAVLLIPFVLWLGGSLIAPRALFWWIVLRTVLHILGIGIMFTALQYLPLADAIAIAFVMPFIMLILGWFFLNEEIGTRRMAACLVGFVGTLLVIQPSFADVGAPAFLPLAVAFIFAFFMLVTRKIAKEIDPMSLQASSGIIGSLMLAVVVGISTTQEIEFFALLLPSNKEIWLLATVGVIGTVGHLLMTWSLRFAPSATLAPMQYLEIPVGAVVGWLFFRELPNGLAAVGIAITIAAGLYVLHRERLNAIANR